MSINDVIGCTGKEIRFQTVLGFFKSCRYIEFTSLVYNLFLNIG